MHYFCSFFLFFSALSSFAPNVSGDCVIQAFSYLPLDPDGPTTRIWGGELDHIQFMCEVADIQNASVTKSLPLKISDEHKLTMIEKLERGELISNISTLSFRTLCDTLQVGDDAIAVSPEADIVAAIGEGDWSRSRGIPFGDKKTLVVRVTDSQGLVVPSDAAQVGDDIFGTKGDPINLKSQFLACSYGKVDFIAGDPPVNSAGEHEVAPGVIEVQIDVSLKQASRLQIYDATNKAAETKLGFTLPGPYDHVIHILEGCYGSGCGWAAYAFVNGWSSVYQGVHTRQAAVFVHELGHNFNLAHSGQGRLQYLDHTCSMGNPLFADDLGKMCFNGAKSWQLGWYDDSVHTFEASDGSWLGTIIGVADYGNNEGKRLVVVKLETETSDDFFITFNRATGINSQNDEADNMVTIVEAGANGKGYSQSWLRAKLSTAETYRIGNFARTGKTLSITVKKVDISSDPGYAEVNICLGEFCGPTAPTSPPTSSPPSCVSGEAAVLTSAHNSHQTSITKVKDLKIGDRVRGFDSQMTPRSCKIEAIGSFGVGEVYGNFTADHYVFNPSSGAIEQHGMDGPVSLEEKFDLIADCPLIVDEVGKRFAPIDSDFCGGNMKKLSWSDYLLLHSAILNVVREFGAFWFDGSSYSDMKMVQKYAPRVCKNMVKCMKNHKKCKRLEKVSKLFINNALTEQAKAKAKRTFHRIGSPCEIGSVAAVITSGRSVDESMLGTAVC